MKKLIAICLAFVLLGIGTARATVIWTQLNYPGAAKTYINGISGNHIIGDYYDANDVEHGFIYDVNEKAWTQFDYPESTGTYAFAISGNNIGGGYYDANDVERGFVYDVNAAAWTSLDYPEATKTYVEYISGNNIVGRYYDADDIEHSFLYDMNDAEWTQLDYPEATETYIYGICGNNIVGSFSDADNLEHSFLYDANNAVWTQLDYPGANHTYIEGISANIIFGSYYGEDDIDRGFVYDVNDAAWTSLNYPGAAGTYIYGICGSSIVGGYYNNASDIDHGFLYNVNNAAWTRLDFPGVTWTYIDYISGNNIVGSYYDTDDNDYSFLASIIPTSAPALPESHWANGVGDVYYQLGGVLKIWDLSGSYSHKAGEWQLDYTLTQNASGKIVGTGTASNGAVNGGAAVPITLKGGINAAGLIKLTLKGSVKGVRGQIKATIDAGSKTLNGTLKMGKQSATFTAALPAGMDGSAVLELHSTSANNNPQGTAKITLSNGTVYSFSMKGKFNVKNDASSLMLKGLAKGTSLKLKINGDGLINSLKGKMLGQKLDAANIAP